MSPEPVARDSRGILSPWLVRQRFTLNRYPPGDALDGIVNRFWAVSWELPPNTSHTQQVLTHPGANLAVGHAERASGVIEARLYGVTRHITSRTLSGNGWTVAAMTTPGGLGAFIRSPARTLTDRVVPFGQVLDVEETAVVEAVTAAEEEAARVAVLRDALAGAVRPERADGAREVAAVARLAETDRTIRRLADLCARSGIGQRTLQRMFAEYAGVSPTWVLRRYRLLDAAEAVKDGEVVAWSQVAVDLGYADQAHLTRDFRAAIGTTPAAYAAAQRPAITP